MKLLVINPNTSAGVTETIVAVARAAAAPGTEITGVTAPFGAAYITSRSEAAIAGHAVLQALATHGRECDAVLIGAFTDSGLWAARELMPVPVVGMAEAAMLTACLLGGRFSIVTLMPRVIPIIEELAAAYGLAPRLAGVRAPHDLRPGSDTDEIVATLRACCLQTLDDNGCDALLLGGAPFAKLVDELAADLPVPILDGISCGVRMAEALVRAGVPKPTVGSYARPGGKASVGLDPALEAMLAANTPP